MRSNNKSENKKIHRVTKCRVCGSPMLESMIKLGDQYIASIFPKNSSGILNHEKYPLELVRCSDPNGCGLVQLHHSISPNILYDDYGYRSGINEQMRANLKEIALKAEEMVSLKPGDTVLDIGCNDGTLLCAYSINEIKKIGIDPARNVAEEAEEKGLEVINNFFSIDLFTNGLVKSKPKIITSLAMFYDLEDPCGFARDVASLLADDGVWVIELSYLPTMLKNNSFDTICHEHLEYYSLKQLDYIISKSGLFLSKIELNEINGGSIRLFITKRGLSQKNKENLDTILKVRETEKVFFEKDDVFKQFSENVQKVKGDFLELLQSIKDEDKKVYIYGASTKGNTLLQYFGIGSDYIEKAADRNSQKWGREIIGTGIKIVSEEEARADCPDYFLALPWSFIDSFMAREYEFLKRGGKFIVPLPKVRVLSIDDRK